MADTITYVDSTNLSVFPCVSRDTGDTQKDLNSKLMNEFNITNIIKSITDKDSYIISWDTTSGLLKCVIDGYYFELILYPTLSENANAKYLRLVYNQNYTDNGIQVLLGDALNTDNSIFTGLEVVETDQANLAMSANGAPFLPILIRDEDGTPTIPPYWYVKFNANSLDIASIDCGKLTIPEES